jgi:hypothetical protein
MMPSSLSKALWIVALSGLLAGSGACGGSSDSGDSGAGGKGGGGGAGISRFVGTWHPTSGNTTVTCAGTPYTDAVVDNLSWGAGVGADLVQTSGTCVFKANVTASTAAALPSQSCTESSGTGALTVTLAAYTFSLGADGLTATESASGSAVVNDSATGQTVTCTYSELASYQKIAN